MTDVGREEAPVVCRVFGKRSDSESFDQAMKPAALVARVELVVPEKTRDRTSVERQACAVSSGAFAQA